MADNLWFLRQKRNMKVGDLSSKSGVPAKLIEAYEKGEPIKMADLPRLARALYVDPAQIKVQSDPKGAPPQVVERPKPPTPPPAAKTQGEKPTATEKPAAPKAAAKKKKGPHPHSPARPTQITHLLQLAQKLGEDEAAVTTAVGKPLTELTVAEVRERLLYYTQTIQTRKANGELPDSGNKDKGALNYKRAYLPEGVDRFELVYLTARQQKGEMVTFKFISGEVLNGRVIGFSPYNITVEQDDGQQITIQKLALAYYTVTPQEATS